MIMMHSAGLCGQVDLCQLTTDLEEMNYQACFATHSLRELLVVICVLLNVSIVSRKIQVLMKRMNIFRDELGDLVIFVLIAKHILH